MKRKLTEEQRQVILTGIFGDGCLVNPRSGENYTSCYTTSCKYEEYILYKQYLLRGMSVTLGYIEKNGYSQTPIHRLATKQSPLLREIRDNTLEENLNLLTELGVALWFYDDGSLHKKGRFYNLNTHYFSEETQRRLFIPFFNKLGIYPVIAYDKKQDGRVFTYLRVGIHDGSYEINNILREYPLECYSYKLWPEDYYQKYKEMKERGLSKEQIKTEIKIITSNKVHEKRKLESI